MNNLASTVAWLHTHGAHRCPLGVGLLDLATWAVQRIQGREHAVDQRRAHRQGGSTVSPARPLKQDRVEQHELLCVRLHGSMVLPTKHVAQAA